MSIYGRTGRCQGRCIETSGSELKYYVDLFPRYVELFNDVVDARTGLKILEHGRHRHPGIAKYPCAAQSAWYAFNGGTSGPIERSHFAHPFIVPFTTEQYSALRPRYRQTGMRKKEGNACL
jgi:hypothetical protein